MLMARFLASSGSAIGNLILFAGIAASWPGSPACDWTGCFHPHPFYVTLAPTFEPFIENPGQWGAELSSEPACPDPQVRDSRFNLDHAPLPPSFDPFAYPKVEMFACVLVGAGGEPLAVRLIGVRRADDSKQLADTIHERWSFSQSWEAGALPAWVRVRLNRGPMEAAMSPVHAIE